MIYADKQREESPFVSVNNLIGPKKVDSSKKTLEGNGVNVANSTVDPPNYEMFEAEVKRIGEEKQQNEDTFWAMKGIVIPPPSSTNIGYRDFLAQNVGGSNIAIIQASLVMIGYNLGTYGTAGNGVDGKMGPLTGQAIKAFQNAARLTPTGKVDGN